MTHWFRLLIFVFITSQISIINAQNSITTTQSNYTSYSPESKQFEVTGKDKVLTGFIARRADALRSSLMKILKIKEQWKHPINIILTGSPGDPAPLIPIRSQTILIGDELSFRIYIHLGRGINQDQLRKEIISTLLFELALRPLDIESIPDNTSLPAWFITGIDQAVLWANDKADRTLYKTLFQQNCIQKPEDFLKIKKPQSELDATSYAVYQCSCGALMQCLLQQDLSVDNLKTLLNEVLLSNDDAESIIKRHFPQLSITATSLHKWWALQLSRMADTPLTESLSIAETERHLRDALTLIEYNSETRTAHPFSLENIDKTLSLPDRNRQLTTSTAALLHLSRNCFPTYRPLIIEYSRIVAQLQLNKIENKENIKKSILTMREIRELSIQTTKRVRDYLDWYEINTRHGSGKTFRNYAETMHQLRNKLPAPNTKISQYLLDIEKLYTLPANAPTPKL